MPFENFEDLTDVELRRKLLEYDFPNVPITETSRGFLLKKLKNHMKNLNRRKLAASTVVTVRAKQEFNNLVSQANDWSQSNGRNARVSDTTTLTGIERSFSSDSVAQRADQLYQPASNTSPEHSGGTRTQFTNQQISTFSGDHSHSNYLSIIWKVFGKQENYTNSIWCGFTLFFLVITFMYMVKTSDLSKFINVDSTNYVTCDRRDPAGPLVRPFFVCIDKERLEPALTIVRNLLGQLRVRSERHYCYDHKQPEAISVTEFIRSMFEEGSIVDLHNVRDAQYLITCNPQWKIDMVDQKGAPANFIGVDKILPNQHTFFVLRHLHLPLPCLLLLKAHRFISFVGNVAFLVVVFMMFFLAYCCIRRIQEQRLRDVQSLLNKIVEELRHRAAANGSPDERDLVVNHLRDQLIPASKRKCRLKLWNEALRELEENDSRVRFDVTVCDGEEFRTMRWVDDAAQSVARRVAEDSSNTTEVETNC